MDLVTYACRTCGWIGTGPPATTNAIVVDLEAERHVELTRHEVIVYRGNAPLVMLQPHP